MDWIKVKTETPKFGEHVLVLHEDNGLMESGITDAYYNPKWAGSFGSGVENGGAYQHVTHWQPLPSPPKE